MGDGGFVYFRKQQIGLTWENYKHLPKNWEAVVVTGRLERIDLNRPDNDPFPKFFLRNATWHK